MEDVKKEKKKKRFFEVVPDEYRKHPKQEITLPVRSTEGSAGYDFYLAEELEIKPKDTILVYTDVRAHFEKKEVLKLYIRSSIAGKKGIVLKNSVGILDKDYYGNLDNGGNIIFLLYNIGTKPVKLEKGERIGQGIFEKCIFVSSEDEENDKQVRKGGYGSTDKE